MCLMDQPLDSKNQSTKVCEDESIIKCEIKECCDMNCNPYGESSSQCSTEANSCEQLAETFMPNIKQEVLSDHSDASLNDSSSESGVDEEFSDLFQRCYPKSSSDTLLLQSTDEDREAEEDVIHASVRITNNTRANSSDGSAQHNTCSVCKKNFSKFQYLKLHFQRCHLTERQYRCTRCEITFDVRTALTQHIRLAHADRKLEPYKCDSGAKGGAPTHQPQTSEGYLREKPHACSQCDSRFSLKSHLTQHIRFVHNQEKSYACPECQKAFTSQSHLQMHVDVVHKCLKPHICAECGRSFSQKHHLQLHIKTVHLKQKPHSCSECSKSFSRLALLRNHIDAKHNSSKMSQL